MHLPNGEAFASTASCTLIWVKVLQVFSWKALSQGLTMLAAKGVFSPTIQRTSTTTKLLTEQRPSLKVPKSQMRDRQPPQCWGQASLWQQRAQSWCDCWTNPRPGQTGHDFAGHRYKTKLQIFWWTGTTFKRCWNMQPYLRLCCRSISTGENPLRWISQENPETRSSHPFAKCLKGRLSFAAWDMNVQQNSQWRQWRAYQLRSPFALYLVPLLV